MFCDDREGWDGGSGKEALGGRGIRIHRADGLCCTAETNTTFYNYYPPIKTKLFRVVNQGLE